jgi:hypothetical protein
VIVAVYVVAYDRATAGVNVAILLLYATAPATDVPSGPVNVKVVVVMEDELISTLNVVVTGELTATFVAPCAGVTETTPGRLTVSWPHPTTYTARRAARKHTNRVLYLRICTSSPTVVTLESRRHYHVREDRNAAGRDLVRNN